MAKTYGYIRVSTQEQNEERQLVAMRDFGIEDGNTLLDKQSGKDFERTAYRRLLITNKTADAIKRLCYTNHGDEVCQKYS